MEDISNKMATEDSQVNKDAKKDIQKDSVTLHDSRKTELSHKETDNNLKASSEQELFLDLCPGAIDELGSFTVLDDCEGTKEVVKVEDKRGNLKKEIEIANEITSAQKEEKRIKKEEVVRIGVSDDKRRIKPKQESQPKKEEPQQEHKNCNKTESKNKTIEKTAEDSLVLTTCDDHDISVSSKCSTERDKIESLKKVNNCSFVVNPQIKSELKVSSESKAAKSQLTKTAEAKCSSKDSSSVENRKTSTATTKIQKETVASAKQKNNSRCLWATNISKSLKAANLKQHCLQFGKVISAKIVTDGKHFFGYVMFENETEATECIQKLNGTTLDGSKVSLSFTKPKISPQKVDTKEKQTQKEKFYSKHEHKTIKKLCEDDPLTTKFVTETKAPKRRSRSREQIDIHLEYIREKREREKLRRRIMEQEEQQREERRKQRKREEEQREVEWKLKQERRKLQLERELLEKERKEMLRLEQERKKIEEEKEAVSREKAKLEVELRIAKKLDAKKRKEIEKDEEKRKKIMVKSKISDSYGTKREDRRYQHHYKSKEYPRPPPVPKLTESIKLKPNCGGYDHRHLDMRTTNFPPSKPDAYDRKFDYKKSEPVFSKQEFSGRKVVSDRFDIRSHRDLRRDSCEKRSTSSDVWKMSLKPAEKSWYIPAHQEVWKMGGCSSGIPHSSVRHETQDSTFVAGRCDGYHYHHHPTPMGGDFTKYEQYSQSNRKY